MRQLTSLDAQFLAVEDGRVHGHVMGLGVYDPSTAPNGELTRRRLLDLVASRMHLLPPLYLKLAEVPFGLDYPYWVVDDELDLHHHIRESWAPPGVDDRGLAELAADVASRPLDRSRPLWELHMIHGLPKGRVAVMTKLHHAAIDGVSGEELIATLLDSRPDAPPTEGRPVPASDDPGDLGLLARGVTALPLHPLRVLRSARRAMPHLDLVPNLGTLPGVGLVAGTARRVTRSKSDGAILVEPAGAAPRTRFNRTIGRGRSVAFAKLSLTEVKTIKTSFGVTVNDVVMAIVTDALRQWMQDGSELPEKPLRAVVPISVRNEAAGPFGNQIGMLFAELSTDEPDLTERITRVTAAMTAAKQRHQAVPATLLQDANHFIPPAVFGRAARAMMRVATQPGVAVGANLLVSNVPGSREPLYLAGAELVAQYPVSAIFHGLGLNVTVLSYRDGMDWGIVCDESQDAWAILAAIKDAQARLLEAATAR
jgi:WS/DGAT/MGAT family acyltransferase